MLLSGDLTGQHLAVLNRRVSARHPHIPLCQSFAYQYSDSGLWGIHCVTAAPLARQASTTVLHVLQGLSNVTPDELTAAKAACDRVLTANANNPAFIVGDLGVKSLHLTPTTVGAALHECVDVDAQRQAVAAVTVNDVQQWFARITTDPLTFLAFGDLSAVPRLGELNNTLQAEGQTP